LGWVGSDWGSAVSEGVLAVGERSGEAGFADVGILRAALERIVGACASFEFLLESARFMLQVYSLVVSDRPAIDGRCLLEDDAVVLHWSAWIDVLGGESF
jgi:hypothetical protein